MEVVVRKAIKGFICDARCCWWLFQGTSKVSCMKPGVFGGGCVGEAQKVSCIKNVSSLLKDSIEMHKKFLA